MVTARKDLSIGNKKWQQMPNPPIWTAAERKNWRVVPVGYYLWRDFCTKQKHSNRGRTGWEKDCVCFALIMPEVRSISSGRYGEVQQECVETETRHWESRQDRERKLNLWFSWELSSEGAQARRSVDTSCALSLGCVFKLFCLLSLNSEIRCCFLKPSRWGRCCNWSGYVVLGQRLC